MGEWYNPFDDENPWNPFTWGDEIADVAEKVRDVAGLVTEYGTRGIIYAGAAVGRAIKPSTRVVSSVMNTPIQFSTNSLAFARNQLAARPELALAVPGFGVPLYAAVKTTEGEVEASDQSVIEQLGGVVANTDMYEYIARQLPGGADPDTGSGYFLGDAARDAVESRKREMYPTVYGHVWTPGRDVAAIGASAGVYQEGSTAWNVISGGVDFTYQLAADPTNLIPIGAAAKVGDVAIPLSRGVRVGRRANVTTGLTKQAEAVVEEAVKKGLAVLDENGLISQVADEMGVLQTPRRTVAPNNWEAAKLTAKGRKMIDDFVAVEDADEIWRMSNRKIPPAVANRLAKATTREEVVAILDDSVYSLDTGLHTVELPGITPAPVVTKIGATIKHNIQSLGSFLTEAFPESTRLTLNNPAQAARNADDVMGYLKIPLDDQTVRVGGQEVVVKGRRTLMRELFDALDPQTDASPVDWVGDFESNVAGHMMYQYGFSPDEIRTFTTWRERLQDDIAAVYSSDDMGVPISMDYITTGRNAPLLNSQLLNIDPTLLDPRALAEFGRRIGPVRNMIRRVNLTDDGRVVVSPQRARRVRREQPEVADFVTTPDEVVLEADNPKIQSLMYWGGIGLNRAVVSPSEWVAQMARAFQGYVWKFNTLVSVRYLAKVLPDDMLRMHFSGVLGDHPISAAIRSRSLNRDVFGDTILNSSEVQRLVVQAEADEDLLRRVDDVRVRVSRAASEAADAVQNGAPAADVAALAPKGVDPDQFRKVVDAELLVRAEQMTPEAFGQFIGATVTYPKVTFSQVRPRSLKYSGRLIGALETELKNSIATATAEARRLDLAVASGLPLADEAMAGATRNKIRYSLLGSDAGKTAHNVAVRRGYVVTINKNSVNQAPQYAQGLAQRIGEMAANEEMRIIARFMREIGDETSDVYGLSRAEAVQVLTNVFFDGAGAEFRRNYFRRVGDKVENWDTREVTEAWVGDLLNHFEKYTFNNPDLMTAVETGQWNGRPVSERVLGAGRFRVGGPDPKANAEFADEVRDVYMRDPGAPTTVDYFPDINDTDLFPTEAGRMSQTYDLVADLFWTQVYGKSSDALARVPMFRYARWRAVAEVLPNATPEAAAKILEEAEKLPLPDALMDDLVAAADGASGEATREMVDEYANIRAIQVTNDTFKFKRSRFGTVHSLSFPFFDAFRELTKIMLIQASNPKFIHRADQAVNEFRRNEMLGPGDIDGDGEREGFLYRDPDTGEEMFALPDVFGLSQILQGDMGVPFGGSISAASLSMVSQMYPSLGPVIQLAAAPFLPKDSDFKGLYEFLFPFGPVNEKTAITPWIPVLGNRNVQRWLQAWGEGDDPVASFSRALGGIGGGIEMQKQRAQILNKALVTTWAAKDWNPAVEGIQQPLGQEQIDAWFAESESLANKIWLMTAKSFFTPGNIQPEFFAQTNKGPVLFGVIKNHWNKLRDDPTFSELSYSEQLETFVDMYGNDGIVALLQPITDKPIQGSTASREWQSWYSDNRDVVDANPEVGGFFGPQAAEFDDDIWSLQSAIFDIEYKKPEDLADAIQSAQANFLFNRAMRRFREQNGLTPEMLQIGAFKDQFAAYKSEVTGYLKEYFPAWDQTLASSISTNRRTKQFAQIKRMVADPSLADNKVAIAAKEYLDFRNTAIAQKTLTLKPGTKAVDPRTGFTRKSKQMLDLNTALYERGQALTRRYPEFGSLWDAVLSWEVRSAVEEQD